MQKMFNNRKIVTVFSFVCLVVLGYSCQKALDKNSQLAEQKAGKSQEGGGIAKPPQLTKNFQQVNLVSSTTEYPALLLDPTLLNPWGLTFNGTGAIAWPASQASGLSQLYSYNPTVPSVTRVRAVGIPTFNAETGGQPTGIVFNPTNLFKVPSTTARVNFIFAGTDGVLSAWNGGTNAIRVVDNHLNSAYTGLANGRDGADSFLYAADFRGMEIDVFNKDYGQVTSKPFSDPSLPVGYAPFNIQNVDGMLYVTYAKVDPVTHRSQAGEGFGYVNIFYPNGMLQKRLLSNGELNAPWGITKAPGSFLGDENTGKHEITGSILLIGNFGDGQINAYTEAGQFLGKLKTEHGPIVIEGLWALTFPPGNPTTFNKEHLYFTAGPDDEEEGLFGYITK